MSISLKPERFACVLGSLFGLLLLAHCIGLYLRFGLGLEHTYGFFRLFNFGVEQNVPTLFATLLLLANAFMFFLLYRVGEAASFANLVWLLLATVFCFLAIDEFAALHERLIQPVRERLDVGGYLYFAWIIPYAVAVIALAVLVAVPIWRLGWRYRLLFGAAGLFYLGGSVGVEMLGGKYYEANQQQADLKYRLFQTVEESFEFTGLIVLIYTLLDLLKSRTDKVTVRLL